MLVKTLNFNISFLSLLQLSLFRPAWERGKAGCPLSTSCLALLLTSLLTRLEVGKCPEGQCGPMRSGNGSGEGMEGVAFLSLAEVDTCPWPFSNPLLCGHLRLFLPPASSCAGNRAQAFGQTRALPLSAIPSLFHFLKQGLIELSLDALCSPSMPCAHFSPASAS